jgi:transposase
VEHPGVEIISRDRASAYIEAINTGAPQAIQVAGRWHLLHNLVETIERVLNRRYVFLQEAFRKSYVASINPESVVGENQQPEREQPKSPEKHLTITELQRQHIRENIGHSLMRSGACEMKKNWESVRFVAISMLAERKCAKIWRMRNRLNTKGANKERL